MQCANADMLAFVAETSKEQKQNLLLGNREMNNE